MTGTVHKNDMPPDCVMQYCGLIEFMQANPSLYHMDSTRKMYHDEVATYYNITRDKVSMLYKESEGDILSFWIELDKNK